MEEFIQNHSYSKAEIQSKERLIYDAVLKQSQYMDAGNFNRIHDTDLGILFPLYDEIFFGKRIKKALKETPLLFQCSRRMTMAGAKTETHMQRLPDGTKEVTLYRIKVSINLLYNTFNEGDRPITVTGILCKDRLQAMQKLFEHELVHLLEQLIWKQSSCKAKRFQSIASRFFGHTQHTHQLITPRERAKTEFAIQIGDKVEFEYDGETFVGMVNRITTRASVLVESPNGQQFSNGHKYETYYIPLKHLKKQ